MVRRRFWHLATYPPALGIDPRLLLHVGDRPAVDGAAARAAGMPSIIVGTAGRDAQPILNITDFSEFAALLGW